MNSRAIIKNTIVIVVLPVILALVASEIALRSLFGLGNPVLYDNSPIYGYKPLANKSYQRFWGARLRFNNLGLRADSDWDGIRDNKILFLGDSVTYGGSRVGNQDLFSNVAVGILNSKRAKPYISGNAGVNGWGVENIHALVVETGFVPASVYVTTMPEADFYRGLTRLVGMPYFNKTPGLALLELWYYFCNNQNNHHYLDSRLSRPEQTRYVVHKAVTKLKDMEAFIRARGGTSVVFISPSKTEVLGLTSIDPLVADELKRNGVQAIWIIDDIPEYHLSEAEKKALFWDHVHLTKVGQHLWAKIIAKELAPRIVEHAAPSH